MHATTPRQMSTTLTRSLAGLDEANREDIAGVIASWPLGWRVVLAADDIIDRSAPEAAADGDAAFRLTEAGEELVRECASWVAERARDHESYQGHGGRTHSTPAKALVDLVRRGSGKVPVQWVRAAGVYREFVRKTGLSRVGRVRT